MTTKSKQRFMGYFQKAQLIEAEGLPRSMLEADLYTCCHCRSIVVCNPERTRDRNWCAKHDQYTCEKPGCILNCVDYELLAELALKHQDGSVSLSPEKDGTMVCPQILIDNAKIF